MDAIYKEQSLTSPGDYNVIYGRTDGVDVLNIICPCGQCGLQNVVLNGKNGWAWPNESPEPVIEALEFQTSCGRSWLMSNTTIEEI